MTDGERTTAGPQGPAAPPDPRVTVFGLLVESHARLTRSMEVDMREHCGIGLRTFEVLLRIGRSPSGALTMSELAAATALTSGGVTRLADRLEADGLIRRSEDPWDRRVTRLELTDLGEDTLRTAFQRHLVQLEEQFVSRIDPVDMPVLERVLVALRGEWADAPPVLDDSP